MAEELISYYNRCKSLVEVDQNQGAENSSACNSGDSTSSTLLNTHILPQFILQWDSAFNYLSSDTKIFLIKLDQFSPVIQKICSHLSLYHLDMIFIELRDTAPNWRNTITSEYKNRDITFNWHACYGEGFNPHSSYPISLSYNIFHTRVAACLSFAIKDCKHFDIQYNIPQIGYRQIRTYQQYMMKDTSLLTNVLPEVFAMQKLVHINSGKINKCLYYTLFFPYIPNIKMKCYVHSDEVLWDTRQNEEEVLCLLVFTTNSNPTKLINGIVNEFDKRNAKKIPVAGAVAFEMGIVSEMRLFAYTRRKTSDTGFFAASMVIKQEDDFEMKLVEFKRNLERHEEEFILCFACFARRGKAGEVKTLSKHFGCSVFYMEVNGELGYDCYTKKHRESAPRSKVKKQRINYFHAYTSIMVYIGWGKPKSEEKQA